MKHLAFLALGAFFTLWQATALAADPQIGRLKLCMQNESDLQRLACYDQELGRGKAAVASSGTTATHAAAAVTSAPATAVPAFPNSDEIGMTPELARKKAAMTGIGAPAPTPKSETATVTKIENRSGGRIVVTLDNGQVWAQLEANEFPVRKGDSITIEQGALGRDLDDIAVAENSDPRKAAQLNSSPSAQAKYELATRSRRIANLLVDMGAQIVLGTVLFKVATAVDPSIMTRMASDESQSGSYIVGACVAVLYYVPMESLYGRTLGKIITGTRVVNEAGGAVTFNQTLGRTLLRFFPFEFVTFLRSQPVGLHDRWSRTRVIRSEIQS